MKNQKVLFVGDVHGKVGEYCELLKKKVNNLKTDVCSIQIGDFGFEKEYVKRHKNFRRSIILESENHLFFGGNHDDYSALPNFHIGDYGHLPFVDEGYFVRGAKSIDKHARTAGHDWWPEEELDWKQAKECVKDYSEVKPKIVATHDAPDSVCRNIFSDDTRINTATGKLLQNLFDIHKPDLWIFGHWHEDRMKEVNNTIFVCLDELSVFELDKSVSVKENIKKHAQKLN